MTASRQPFRTSRKTACQSGPSTYEQGIETILHAAVHGPIAALNEETDETALKAMVRGYLDMAHVKQLGPICPLAFLVTDVANQESEIREVYKQFISMSTFVDCAGVE